jgi:hypothetical protein
VLASCAIIEGYPKSRQLLRQWPGVTGGLLQVADTNGSPKLPLSLHTVGKGIHTYRVRTGE